MTPPACWGKVLNVSCYPACLMSNNQWKAFALNVSVCWGKITECLMLPCLSLVVIYQLKAVEVLGLSADGLMLPGSFDVYLAIGCI